MDLFLKAVVYLFVGVAVLAICVSTVKSLIDKNTGNEIMGDPCYIEAIIKEIIPGTPTSYGIVNIRVTYEFTANNGKTYKKENILTAIKTMDLQKFNVGSTIPVVYLKSDPSKNMLNMRNAMEDYKRFG